MADINDVPITAYLHRQRGGNYAVCTDRLTKRKRPILRPVSSVYDNPNVWLEGDIARIAYGESGKIGFVLILQIFQDERPVTSSDVDTFVVCAWLYSKHEAAETCPEATLSKDKSYIISDHLVVLRFGGFIRGPCQARFKVDMTHILESGNGGMAQLNLQEDTKCAVAKVLMTWSKMHKNRSKYKKASLRRQSGIQDDEHSDSSQDEEQSEGSEDERSNSQDDGKSDTPDDEQSDNPDDVSDAPDNEQSDDLRDKQPDNPNNQSPNNKGAEE